MERVTRPQLAVYAAAAIALALIGARYVRDASAGGEPARAAAPAAVRVDQAGGGRVTVHVAGAVRRPGVYHLEAGARVDDAVRRAGGASRRADLSAINLAAKLEDGRQVLVPVRAPPAGTVAAPGDAAQAAPAQPVNLNTATLEQLDALAGVGPATAQKILDYREQHGAFSAVDELDRVPGIGPGKLAALRDLVRV